MTRASAGDAAGQLVIGPNSPPGRTRRAIVAPYPPGHEGPGGEAPPQLPVPKPAVAVMDIGIQIRNLTGGPRCLTDDERSEFREAVAASVAEAYPKAWVSPAICYDQGGANETAALGVWLQGFPGSYESVLRGLNSLDLLQAGEEFGYFLSSTLIYDTAGTAWNALPHVLDEDGNADSGGTVNLTGFSLEFLPESSTVATVITGYDSRPFPDAHFTLTISDQLGVSQRLEDSTAQTALEVTTTTSFSVDHEWLEEIAGLLASAWLASAFSAGFLLAFAFFAWEGVEVVTASPPGGLTGAGAAALASLPFAVMQPGGVDLYFLYDRLQVTEEGIFAGGINDVLKRSPTVAISGQHDLSVSPGGTASAFFTSAAQHDLRPPLTHMWSGDGELAAQGGSGAQFTFLAGELAAGKVVPRVIKLSVTDADGLTATASFEVLLHVVGPAAPPGSGGPSEICRQKPWLCRPQT